MRASSEGLRGLLEEAFAPYRVRGAGAPANLSVRLGAAGEGGKAQGFHLLFREGQRALRSRDPRRLLQALVAHLSSYEPVGEGLLRLPGVALVRDGEASLACLAARSSFDVIERRLNANRLFIVDEPFILIDPLGGELVVPEPTLRMGPSIVDRVETVVGGQRRPEPTVAPGRYPVTRWTYVLAEEPAQLVSPARGVLWGALLTSRLTPRSRGDAVRTLAALAERVRPTAVSWEAVASGAWCEG